MKLKKKKRQVADGRGGKGEGEEPNHTTTKKPGPQENYSIVFGLTETQFLFSQ
jgi:hypothetical protein